MLVGVLPVLVGQIVVKPNEIDRESPYIARAIDATRRAFGLQKIKLQPFIGSKPLTAADVAAHGETLANVRLWDHRPLLRTFKQLQEIRQYYEIVDVDSDRYVLDGRLRQVLVGAREMNVGQLDEKSRTWLNAHLEYTHGYGLSMCLANAVDAEGKPGFVVRDVPPVSLPGVTLREPRLYFGEVINLPPEEQPASPTAMLPAAPQPAPRPDIDAERRRRRLNDSSEPDGSDYLLVNTTRDEFDYPETIGGAEVKRRTSYHGRSGVSAGSWLRRVMFGLRFHSFELAFTRLAKPESRLLMHRQVTRRCQLAAPFLVWDTQPYPAVVGGRVVWICEGYTMSQSYPYSEIHLELEMTPHGPRYTPTWNYLRNPVKGVVNAYDGTIDLYVVDEADPLVRTWQRVYPGVLKPASAIPAELRAHFRYPQLLFRTQSDMYQRYHMTEPSTFYAGEDLWAPARHFDREIAGDVDEKKPDNNPDLYQPMPPYYIEMSLPGEEEAQFMLLSAFTPFSARGGDTQRDNMIAYLVALCDPGRYGELHVYRFPKDRTIYGPLQVEALIEQDETVSREMTLWDKGGSKVIRGHLLIVPVGASMLYVQPMYLEAASKGLPELKRVVVVYDQRVVMAPRFDEALRRLFGAAPATLASPAAPTEPAPRPPVGGVDASVVAEAQAAFDASEAALRAGDWAAAQRERERLKAALERLR
jgi:uncharacterized membrane protein (UPF0182 family)